MIPAVQMTQGTFGDACLYITPIQEICFQGFDKNMLVLYSTLKYFNSDRDMDTLLAGNKECH